MTTRAPEDRMRPSVALVGGGVAGLSLARALARAGADVELFDAAPALGADRPDDAGASALPVALLNPWRGRKGAAHPDDLAGLRATWRLARELEAEGRHPGAHRSGVLRIATSERQAATWRGNVVAAGPAGAAGAEADAAGAAGAGAVVASAGAGPRPAGQQAGGPLAWLEPGAVPAPYHAPHGALLVRDGGRIEPRRWLQALADSAAAAGAALRTRAPVTAAEREAGGAWRVLDAAGAPLTTADAVVLCVGADASPAILDGGRRVAPPELLRSRGEVVTLLHEVALPHPLAGGVYGASSGDGRVWAGGGHRAAEEHDPSAPARLRAAFAWSVPALANAPVAATWSGVRAKTRDARPLVEPLAADLWWFGAFAGRGFLTAAAEAERLVAHLTGAGRTN